MSGTITITKTDDWLTPFEVEVIGENGKASTAKFMAAARAQTYAWSQADSTGYRVVYADLCESEVPTNEGTPKAQSRMAEFEYRYKRICDKCRTAKPLVQFGKTYHQNRATNRAKVFHGYTALCLDCQGVS